MASKDNHDLDGMSVQDLTALIAAAEAKRTEKMDGAKAELIAEMEEKAASRGRSLDKLMGRGGANTSAAASGGRKPRKDAGALVPAKYRGPEGQEWSGRGRPPTWLVTLEGEGKNREDFRI